MSGLTSDLETRLGKVAQQVNYPPDAILFVLRGLAQPRAPGREVVHVDAAELCWRLHDQALAVFGENARNQLKTWGIQSTSDFGRIVFGLIAEGLAMQNDTDKPEDFENVFDFDTAFEQLRYPPPPSAVLQFRISTLLLITTVTAIALPGAIVHGLTGALGTLFAAWLALIGGYCAWLGVRGPSHGRTLAFIFGALFCIGGIVAFALVSRPNP
jgi:uncharacterized repeat protein (TIGR04138 family)